MSPDAEPQPAAAPELAAGPTWSEPYRACSADGQRRVVESALVFLGTTMLAVESGHLLNLTMTSSEGPSTGHLDVRSLKEQKNPWVRKIVAALVAYYLAEIARRTPEEAGDWDLGH